ncbi:DUF885 domain-containing protein [Hyphococcus lacteus]|uniref:DUF885 domain-containing protein n=1 Tax=Hyphococcus lacteus TaxID=3143536 RepID=A0ABV3Z2A2_9PROT
MKKTILLLACSTLLLVACDSQNNTARSEGTANQDFRATETAEDVTVIADDYINAMADVHPLYLVATGLAADYGISNTAFEDISPEATARFEAAEDQLLSRINMVDPDNIENRNDWVLHQSLKETLEASIQMRVCKTPLWSLNHMSGWQNSLGQIVPLQPVSTAEERTDALERWAKLPAYLAHDRANLEAGLAQGYSAPKRVVARVIKQLDIALATPPAESPFIGFIKNAEDAPEFSSAAERLVIDKLNPAIASYRAFLNDTYMPAARDALAVTALPDGDACYEAFLRLFHGANIGSKATFENGQKAVAANMAGLLDRGEEVFGTRDLGEILAQVKDAPGNRFETEEELISFTRDQVAHTREKSEPFFSALPEQEMVVEPYPDYLKGTGQSSRYEPTEAEKGPATYRINTDDWAEQTRGEAMVVVVHEGWPGHHLQLATFTEKGDLHPAMKLLGSSAAVEGWARYAEALAEEAGIYHNVYGEITRRAWPARGMVGDPGLHAYGWTNEETAAYFIETGNFNEETAEVLLDRMAVIPGQLTGYDTGGLEIFALRREAEERLGDRFDIRAFHDHVLEVGMAPISVIRANVEAWIEEEAAQ